MLCFASLSQASKSALWVISQAAGQSHAPHRPAPRARVVCHEHRHNARSGQGLPTPCARHLATGDEARRIGCAQQGGRPKMVINWRRTSRLGLSWTTVAVALTAAGAGAALAQDKPTFYVIAPSLTDPFWITQQNG